MRFLLAVAVLLLRNVAVAFALVALPDVLNHADVVAKNPASSADGIPIRVCLIGDSIVMGYASHTFDGFRQRLYDLFVESGAPSVEFIGTQSLGPDTKMANHFEGYPAHRVMMLHDKVMTNNALVQQPNVIMLLAGSNDLDQPEILFSEEEPRGLALYRLQIMIEWIMCVAPTTVLLVGTLPPMKNETAQALTDEFNAALPTIIQPGVNEGFKLQLVELADLRKEDMDWDGIHPNDQGYGIIAQRWFDAVQSLPSGWLLPPIQPDIKAGNKTAAMCNAHVPKATTCPRCEGIWNCLWAANDTRCGSY